MLTRKVRVIGAYGLSDTFGYHGPLQRIGFKADLFRQSHEEGAPKTNVQLLSEDASLIQVDMKPSNARRVWVEQGKDGFEAERLLLYQRDPDAVRPHSLTHTPSQRGVCRS